jgi:hypothetical protein
VPLQLNKRTRAKPDAPSRKNELAFNIDVLAEVLASTTLNREQKWESVQDLNIDIGLDRYQQELPDDAVLEAFRAAATAGSSLWEVRTEPREYNEYMTLKDWSWIIAFGSETERKKLAGVGVSLLASDDNKAYVETRAVLRLLQGYLATAKVDQASADAVIAAASRKKASRVDASTAKPYAQGLSALVRGDADAWNVAIGALVKDHEHDAFRGELVDLSGGFIAAIPLSLLRLGIERGLVCTTKSLHLPIRLVEQAWKLSVSG